MTDKEEKGKKHSGDRYNVSSVNCTFKLYDTTYRQLQSASRIVGLGDTIQSDIMDQTKRNGEIANINAIEKPPLRLAVETEDWDCVLKMVETGADSCVVFSDGNRIINIICENIKDMVHEFRSMHTQAFVSIQILHLLPSSPKPHLTQFQVLSQILYGLMKHNTNLNTPDRFGRRPLSCCLEALYEHYSYSVAYIGVQVLDNELLTVHPEAVVMLLDLDYLLADLLCSMLHYGASSSDTDSKGQTWLHKLMIVACQHLEEKDHKMYEEMIQVIEENLQDDRKESIGDELRRQDNSRYKVVDQLIKCGHDVFVKDELGISPLRYLIKKGPNEFNRYLNLFQEHNINLNSSVDDLGNTLLHLVCGTRNVLQMDVLLCHDASLAIQNEMGKAPLHILCEKTPTSTQQGAQTFSLLAFLSNHYVNNNVLNIQDLNGWSILHTVLQSSPEQEAEIMQILLGKGASANLGDKFHITPLHMACNGKVEMDDNGLVQRTDKTTVIRVLLEAGADITAKDIYSRTPLEFTKYYNLGCSRQILQTWIQTQKRTDAELNSSTKGLTPQEERVFHKCHEELIENVSYLFKQKYPHLSMSSSYEDTRKGYRDGRDLLHNLLLTPGVGLLNPDEEYDEIYRQIHLLMKRLVVKIQQLDVR